MDNATRKKVNVQRNEEFQTRFNGFYKIRQRPKIFYKALYSYLEKNKNKKTSFEQTLNFFLNKTDRFESSFSSKVIATTNPNFPIWDSEVLGRLKLEIPPNNLNREVRFKELVKTYDYIINWYSDFLDTKEARDVIKNFDKKIGVVNISDIKKIDFILWQTRD